MHKRLFGKDAPDSHRRIKEFRIEIENYQKYTQNQRQKRTPTEQFLKIIRNPWKSDSARVHNTHTHIPTRIHTYIHTH